ncbi:MAG: ATP-binding protein [Thermodesulfovibrionales bacterium]
MKLNISAKFLLSSGIVLSLCLGISFYIIAKHQESLILEQAENEAKAIFKQIIITRKWVADHGGIFVEQKPWLKPNTYLGQVGEESLTMDIMGRKFIKENPAFVTRELSRYARERELYWFKITSLKLLNPMNSPDEWERQALKEFEITNKKELSTFQSIDGKRYLRYISPLYVEESCLRCHAKQGYRVGDVRGAISVTIPVERIFAEIGKNRQRMFIAAFLTLSILMTTLYFFVNKLTLSPLKRLKEAIQSFSEGEAPQKDLLRTGDEIESIARSFYQMAERLTEYHNCLHDRIKSAVKELEEANKKLIESNRLLNEANRKKSDFIARASHELRTPLTSIKGALDYLGHRLNMLGLNGDEGEFVEMIKRNTDRLIRMVNDMLDIEKIEAGLQELNIRESDLCFIINECLENFKLDAESKRIKFSLDMEPSLLCPVDEERIKQVFTNLLSNALRWSPPDSGISIKAKRLNGMVTVEISDSGPGIAPEEQHKVFEKFYKRSKDGTGLGLTIAKSIVEAHGGEIGVESDGKQGSTFYVRLRRVDSLEKTEIPEFKTK